MLKIIKNKKAQQTPSYQPVRYYTKPSPTTPLPKSNKIAFIALGIVLVLIIVGGLIYYLRTTAPAPTPVEVVEKPAIPKPAIIPTKLEITYNGFVTEPNIKRVNNLYHVGQDVMLQTTVWNFSQKEVNGNFLVDLNYGIEIRDEGGRIIFLEKNFDSVKKMFDEKQKGYYFTAVFPTNKLFSGTYRIISTVTDNLKNKQKKSEIEFILMKPIFLEIKGPLLGYLDPATQIFTEQKIGYYVGDLIEAQLNIRGFKVAENNKVDVRVAGYFLDSNKNIIEKVSNENLFVSNQTFEFEPEVLTTVFGIPTAELESGEYYLRIEAFDNLGGQKAVNEIEIEIK